MKILYRIFLVLILPILLGIQVAIWLIIGVKEYRAMAREDAAEDLLNQEKSKASS
jgi:hypothetical protein